MAINDSLDNHEHGLDTSKLTYDIADFQLKVVALARKTVSDLDEGCMKFPFYAAKSKLLKSFMDEADLHITALKDFAAQSH